MYVVTPRYSWLQCTSVVANLELGARSGVWSELPVGSRDRAPGRGSGGGRSLELKAFLFLDIPTEGAIFRLTSKFRKLRKPHIFQVTSD